jgi:hypothetical protein
MPAGAFDAGPGSRPGKELKMSDNAWKWAIAALLVGAACQSSGKVSVSAQAVTPAATDGGATAGPLDLGQGILVNRVRLAVLKVALEGAQAAADAGSAADAGTDMGMSSSGLVADHGGDGSGGDGQGEDDAEEGEVKVGPFAIDLTGDQMKGGITQVFDGDVPPGTYHELKVVIAPLSSSSSTSTSTADGGTSAGTDSLNGQTVIVDGTVDGTAFTFQAIFHAAQKRESTITVSAGGSSSNVTLSIDPSGWFKAADGSRLNPADTGAASAIVDNIRASIRAFDDDDRDGQEDDHGGSSGGGDGHH